MRLLAVAVVVALFLMCVFDVSENLKVIPQKVNVTYLNPKYLEWGNFTIKRYGRKSDYYMNVEGKKYHTWGNNVTLHLIFYQYLHNEYRRSFVEMHFKLCDLMSQDMPLGRMLSAYTPICPVVEKEVHMMNMTVPGRFPYELPFEQARLDGRLTITGTDELIAEGYMFVLFKPK